VIIWTLFISWSPEISSLKFLPVSRKFISKFSETHQEITRCISVLISHSQWLKRTKSFPINLYYPFFDCVLSSSRPQASFCTVHTAEKFFDVTAVCTEFSERHQQQNCLSGSVNFCEWRLSHCW